MFTTHIFLFLVSLSVIWFFSGLIIEATHRVAQRFNQSSFTAAFFILGFLTSISEISVAINSTTNKTPQVSAGNIVGASFLVILFIIPLLAIVGNKIHLKNTLNEAQLLIALIIIALPTFFLLDGAITVDEGLACLIMYAVLPYSIHKVSSMTSKKVVQEVEQELMHTKHTTDLDIIKILLAGGCIFIAGYILVEEVVFFAEIFKVPSSIIGLLILSIGTNIPEITVAIRAILKSKSDIAFGNYLGSATANTLIFGFLAIANGPFTIHSSGFKLTAILIVIGFTLLFFFAKSKNVLSKKEASVLISIYIAFFIIQAVSLFMLVNN
jgi:cation:H+ antiporter